MALTEKQQIANKKYFEKNYKQVKLSMPNVEAQELINYCDEHDISRAGFIRQAIKEKMARDS